MIKPLHEIRILKDLAVFNAKKQLNELNEIAKSQTVTKRSSDSSKTKLMLPSASPGHPLIEIHYTAAMPTLLKMEEFMDDFPALPITPSQSAKKVMHSNAENVDVVPTLSTFMREWMT